MIKDRIPDSSFSQKIVTTSQIYVFRLFNKMPQKCHSQSWTNELTSKAFLLKQMTESINWLTKLSFIRFNGLISSVLLQNDQFVNTIIHILDMLTCQVGGSQV